MGSGGYEIIIYYNYVCERDPVMTVMSLAKEILHAQELLETMGFVAPTREERLIGWPLGESEH